VVVVGETPYAEFLGDRADLGLATEDLQAIARVKQAGIPVVVVLISGRPMVLGEALTMADALVAAWLPGSEGQGVADVLFGDARPTGKLPFSWPRSMEQIPVNVGDAGYDPLFPYGFGLSY
jgi:beta-glucosidase